MSAFLTTLICHSSCKLQADITGTPTMGFGRGLRRPWQPVFQAPARRMLSRSSPGPFKHRVRRGARCTRQRSCVPSCRDTDAFNEAHRQSAGRPGRDSVAHKVLRDSRPGKATLQRRPPRAEGAVQRAGAGAGSPGSASLLGAGPGRRRQGSWGPGRGRARGAGP